MSNRILRRVGIILATVLVTMIFGWLLPPRPTFVQPWWKNNEQVTCEFALTNPPPSRYVLLSSSENESMCEAVLPRKELR